MDEGESIRIDIKETECEDASWIYLAQERNQWRLRQ
jgi:hypothetical protein